MTLPCPQEPNLTREAFYADLRGDYPRLYKTSDALSIEALFNVIHTFAMVEARLAARIQEKGITLAGLNVLSVLRKHGRAGCPLHALSRLLLVSRANITGLIDSLVRKGFVVRENHATDRRVILAKITQAGERWLNAYMPGHHAEIRQMFSGLTVKEKTMLVKLLTKLRRTSGSHPREF